MAATSDIMTSVGAVGKAVVFFRCCLLLLLMLMLFGMGRETQIYVDDKMFKILINLWIN